MLIHVKPKKIKQVVISATFEHQGISYEERFSSKKRFLSHLKRTKDIFVNAVDYASAKVIKPCTLAEYISI